MKDYDTRRRKAAESFARDWKDKGSERGQTQSFWHALLRDVYGVPKPERLLQFEKDVKLDQTGYVDAYIFESHVLIEQKGFKVDLNKSYKQSDGTILTPYKQAKRYADELPYSEKPRWIVVCNFQEFHIYDMDVPKPTPEIVRLENLKDEYEKLDFLVDFEAATIRRETRVSIQAGDFVAQLCQELAKQYQDLESLETSQALNALCVRLVFCLYADGASLFGEKDLFKKYLRSFSPENARLALKELFRTFNEPLDKRDKYLDPKIAAFPYVNGGLFERETPIPQLNEKIVELLTRSDCKDFEWNRISPTIFGAVFESALNPETRRKGGMHYTSIENIHKVIDPLFLDDLKAEFQQIKDTPQLGKRKKELEDFQKKLASLTFLDPACGSGNFLTETYRSLRRLENDVLRLLYPEGTIFASSDQDALIKVSISQFYGIEINDFAVAVAKTALWIAESQALRETEDILQQDLEFLPLKSYSNIVEGNALRIDWENVVPKEKLNYILGNPPFIGYSFQTKEQKADVLSIYVDEKNKPYKTAGKIDYVSCWYFKACRLMQGTTIRAAFVSTNSITQGEQVASVWKPLFDRFDVHIDFAHRTFRWDSEANDKAKVHCVIVGFSVAPNDAPRLLFDNESVKKTVNINAYLSDASNIFIESRLQALCDVPEMVSGNRPTDGGNLIIEKEDIEEFLTKEPNAKPFVKKLIGAKEFIQRLDRYCLWLVDAKPSDLLKMPRVMERVKKVRETRLASPDLGARKLAEMPTLFRETNNPDTFIVVPSVSSERRQYVPLGFLDKSTIPTNLVLIIPNATLYHFGILTSSVHNAWMRAVCGRLEMRYRYSKEIVYNNFPWPDPTPTQRARIEATAQGILDARDQFPDESLASLYDDLVTPGVLRAAHRENDRAVLETYDFPASASESYCVAELFKRYRALTSSR